MARKKLSDYTLEELQKQVKTIRLVTGILIGLILVLFAYATYQTFRDSKFSMAMIVPLTFIPIIAVNFGSAKKIKDEIARRSEN